MGITELVAKTIVIVIFQLLLPENPHFFNNNLELIQTILLGNLDDLEPQLIRQGYNTKVLADLLNIRQKTIRSFLQGQLTAVQTQDLKEKMLSGGDSIVIYSAKAD